MAAPTNLSQVPVLNTPLHEEHLALGGRMVPFAGYALPVHYTTGILDEHLHTRSAAGLFDVSHMGQICLEGPDHQTTSAALERLCAADVLGLRSGRQRYSQLLNDAGGIVDDLMVSRGRDHSDGTLFLVLNASRKQVDCDFLREKLPANVRIQMEESRALVALQGPEAAAVFARHCRAASAMKFMDFVETDFDGIPCRVSRSGYTGEDGFEISIAANSAVVLWQTLLAEPEVRAVGLGARDSLRLEAGLCLFGHDIDESTSPVEAALAWSISKRRRTEGGFPGAGRIQAELRDGPAKKRIGILPDGRAPAREGVEILDASSLPIGTVTSGGFGPTLNAPVSMGYVDTRHALLGDSINLVVRGKPLPARIAPMPFVPNRYHRG